MLRAWIAVVLGVAAVAVFAAPSARSGRDCTVAESRATFDAFVKAFNAGDRAALDRLVAPRAQAELDGAVYAPWRIGTC